MSAEEAGRVRVGVTEDGAWLQVKVHPGARRPGLTGVHDGALKVNVPAAAEKGKANKALVKQLAGVLGVRASAVAVLTGKTSAIKRVSVSGLTPEALEQRLAAARKGTA